MSHFREFLENWFEGSEGYFCLPHLEVSKKKFTQVNTFHNDLEKLANIEKYAHREDFSSYFSLNTFKVKNKRTEENISQIIGVFFDVDSGGLTLTRKIAGFLNEKVQILPIMTLLTSNFEDEEKNKYQLFYKFKTPLEANEENKKNVKALSCALTKFVGSDDVYDLARVARLPYSNNGKINKETEIIYFEKSNLVDYEKLLNWVKENLDFNEAIEHIEKKSKPSITKKRTQKIKVNNSDLEKINPDLLNQLFEKYQKILVDGDSKGKSRSEADFAIVAYMIYQKKFNDETILSIMNSLSNRHDVLNDTERMIRKIRSFGK